MAAKKYTSVNDYVLSAGAPEAIPLMEALRKLIKACVPGAEETISWNVPFYKYFGPLAGFAVYKSHVSFGVATGEIEKKYREALEKKGYTTGSKTIQIKFDQKLPVAILKQFLRAQAKINEAKK